MESCELLTKTHCLSLAMLCIAFTGGTKAGCQDAQGTGTGGVAPRASGLEGERVADAEWSLSGPQMERASVTRHCLDPCG